MNLLGRLTGMRIVAAAALALLTLGAVFAATAAPREALATTTRAVRQTLATAPPLSQTITATAPWSGIVNALNSGASRSQGNRLLTGSQIGAMSPASSTATSTTGSCTSRRPPRTGCR